MSYRGNATEVVKGKWRYVDTGALVGETHETKPCGHCGKNYTPEGHDGCLGTLKGLMNACCGHGVVKDAYVQFLDSSTVHGKDAVTIIEILKKEK